MGFIVTALVILVVILLIYIFLYRLQINKICSQLSFYTKFNSNIFITQDLHAKELNKLVCMLNNYHKQHDKLKEETLNKDKVLRNVITGLSHDIRTPLTSLDGYFQLLAETNDESEKDRYIGIIRKRIDNLKYLLEELFLYTKIQNPEYKLDMQKTDINELISDAAFTFYDSFTEKGITPRFNLTEQKVYLFCDKGAMQRIMQNLLKNTLAHSKGECVISLKKDLDFVVLNIANDYDPHNTPDVSRVFERFYKADTARNKTSTGLGLSIVHELTERMNGKVTAKIEKGLFVIEAKFPLMKF